MLSDQASVIDNFLGVNEDFNGEYTQNANLTSITRSHWRNSDKILCNYNSNRDLDILFQGMNLHNKCIVRTTIVNDQMVASNDTVDMSKVKTRSTNTCEEDYVSQNRTELFSGSENSWYEMAKCLFTQNMDDHTFTHLTRCSNRRTVDQLTMFRPDVSQEHINLIISITHPRAELFYTRYTVI